jgi:hypothetical protein
MTRDANLSSKPSTGEKERTEMEKFAVPVAALRAQDVDRRRGVIAGCPTPKTQAKVTAW